MIPVFIHDVQGSRGLSFKDFESSVLQICEEHQQSGRACAFAFLLHDARTPDLGKVLADPAYWASLDAISGSALTVFSIFNGALRRDEGFLPEDHATHLAQIRRSTEHVLDAYFGQVARNFPSLLFFQVREGAVIGSRLVVLRARGVEATYKEVAEVLTIAANALRDSIGKYVGEPQDAFDRVDRALTTRAVLSIAKEVSGAAKAVLPWLRALFSWM